MKSNFEFLNRYWPALAQIGETAENYLYSDPNACIFKIGLFAERLVQEILAFELTKLVHGEEEATKAQAAAKALFVGGGDDANMPTTEIAMDQLADGKIGILTLMVSCGLAGSNGEARRLVQQGGVFVNDEKVPDHTFAVTEAMLKEGVKIRKGKKVFHKAILA